MYLLHLSTVEAGDDRLFCALVWFYLSPLGECGANASLKESFVIPTPYVLLQMDCSNASSSVPVHVFLLNSSWVLTNLLKWPGMCTGLKGYCSSTEQGAASWLPSALLPWDPAVPPLWHQTKGQARQENMLPSCLAFRSSAILSRKRTGHCSLSSCCTHHPFCQSRTEYLEKELDNYTEKEKLDFYLWASIFLWHTFGSTRDWWHFLLLQYYKLPKTEVAFPPCVFGALGANKL